MGVQSMRYILLPLSQYSFENQWVSTFWVFTHLPVVKVETGLLARAWSAFCIVAVLNGGIA
jgi:hypothetical protein